MPEESTDPNQQELSSLAEDFISYLMAAVIITAIDFAIFYYSDPSFVTGAVRLVLTLVSFLYLLSAVIAFHYIQKKARARPRARYLVAALNVVLAVVFAWLFIQTVMWEPAVTVSQNMDSPIFTERFLRQFAELVVIVVKTVLAAVLIAAFGYSLSQIHASVVSNGGGQNGA